MTDTAVPRRAFVIGTKQRRGSATLHAITGTDLYTERSGSTEKHLMRHTTARRWPGRFTPRASGLPVCSPRSRRSRGWLPGGPAAWSATYRSTNITPGSARGRGQDEAGAGKNRLGRWAGLDLVGALMTPERCADCGARIIWASDRDRGRSVPFDALPSGAGHVLRYEADGHFYRRSGDLLHDPEQRHELLKSSGILGTAVEVYVEHWRTCARTRLARVVRAEKDAPAAAKRGGG